MFGMADRAKRSANRSTPPNDHLDEVVSSAPARYDDQGFLGDVRKPMIDALRHDEIIDKVGGRFKLAALIQRRWVQLMQGARPMVETKGLTEMEVVIKEILEGKIDMELVEEELEDEPV